MACKKNPDNYTVDWSMDMNTQNRLRRAKTLLVLDHPFFGSLLMRLKLVEDSRHPTLATDGVTIKYNAKFLNTLTDPQLQGVLAHEVLHVANGHCWRRNSRNHADWNVACDYALNGILADAGLKLPEGVLLHEGLTGSAESIYTTLAAQQQQGPEQGEQEQQQQQQGSGSKGEPGQEQGDTQDSPKAGPTEGSEKGESKPDSTNTQQDEGSTADMDEHDEQGQEQGAPNEPRVDPGRCGAVLDAPADTEENKSLEADWKVAIVQAAMAAKAAGTMPGSLKEMIDKIVNPKVAWEVLLRDFVERSAKNDFDWGRPNRRYIQRGFVLPSLVSEEIPDVVIAVDTSGSISNKDLSQFAAEVSAVLGAYETTIHLLLIDTEVHRAETLTRADLPLSIEAMGRGGTDFQPALDWVEENDVTPSCMIYLTDLYATFPTEEPDYPMLWITPPGNRHDDAPFGDTVRM